MKKNAKQMEKEFDNTEASLKRLRALHEANQAKRREYKYDEAKDKRIKRSLKSDISKRIAKKRAARRQG